MNESLGTLSDEQLHDLAGWVLDDCGSELQQDEFGEAFLLLVEDVALPPDIPQKIVSAWADRAYAIYSRRRIYDD